MHSRPWEYTPFMFFPRETKKHRSYLSFHNKNDKETARGGSTVKVQGVRTPPSGV
jgi:hypothetical protein